MSCDAIDQVIEAVESVESSEESYDLNVEGESRLVGKSLDVVSKQHMYDIQVKYSTPNGTVIPGDMEWAMARRNWFQVIAEDKVRETLLVDKKSFEMSIQNYQSGKERKSISPLLNIPVLHEKVDGKWKSTPEGKILMTKQVKKLLESSFDLEETDGVYGFQARSVGDEWEADAKYMDIEGISGGTLKMKFLKVEEYEGQECAIISMKAELHGSMGQEGISMNMKMDAEIIRSLQYYVDLSIKGGGEVVFAGVAHGGVRLQGTGKMKMDYTTKVVEPES
ncbi:hypothetical protein [Rubritalea halochordaticola]|uniref:hypothetical protein n=1 Tax=Rubritalea halochordaticola TaxID=714537 RepID=UPI0031FC4D2F